jgi:cysteine desulfurase
MRPYFSEAFYNPSATYLAAKHVHAAVEAARHSVAQALGARSAEVIFTAGGTEANNLAIQSIMGANPGKKLIVSSIEHESVLKLARQYDCLEAPVNDEGMVDIAKLGALIDAETVLISVMYANNEIGSIQPIHEIADLVQAERERRHKAGDITPIYLHTDATQAANYLDLHVSRLGVDLMTLNGGKIYGPKQTGALYARTGVALKPLVYGGGQERALRSGTENVPGIIGFAKALELAQATRHDETKRLQVMQTLFFDLVSEKLPMAIINGARKKRLPNNVHVTIRGEDNERLLMALDEAGIMAAAGSACAASNEEPSHVLRSMGISPADAQSSLRFTMGRQTTEADIRRTVDTLAQLIA